MGKHYYTNPQEGDIKIYPSKPNEKWRYTNGKWVYIKKPKGYFKKDQPKEKWVPNFPPITLPDHIRATKYPHYYVVMMVLPIENLVDVIRMEDMEKLMNGD